MIFRTETLVPSHNIINEESIKQTLQKCYEFYCFWEYLGEGRSIKESDSTLANFVRSQLEKPLAKHKIFNSKITVECDAESKWQWDIHYPFSITYFHKIKHPEGSHVNSSDISYTQEQIPNLVNKLKSLNEDRLRLRLMKDANSEEALILRLDLFLKYFRQLDSLNAYCMENIDVVYFRFNKLWWQWDENKPEKINTSSKQYFPYDQILLSELETV